VAIQCHQTLWASTARAVKEKNFSPLGKLGETEEVWKGRPAFGRLAEIVYQCFQNASSSQNWL